MLNNRYAYLKPKNAFNIEANIINQKKKLNFRNKKCICLGREIDLSKK